MKKIIFFPIETKARELDSKLLITFKLLQNQPDDWIIFIGHYKKIPYLWKIINSPFLVFEKGLVQDISRYEKISQKGGRIILLDEEGGISTKSHIKNPRGSGNKKSLNFISNIFCWGTKEKNKWIEVKKNKNLKIDITGNPRMELSQKTFFYYFNKLNPVKKKYVLISAAFGSGNSITDKSKEITYWKKKGVKEVRNAKPIAEYQKKLLYPYLKGLKKIILNFPKEEFIIRPHPTENIETYNSYFKNIKNIKIIYRGSIQEWLHGAKLHIHNGCTTAIEGFFSGLEPICYAPIIDNEHSQYLTFTVSDVVNTEKKLLNIFSKKINGYKWKIEKKNKIMKELDNEISCSNSAPSDKITQLMSDIAFNTKEYNEFSLLRLKLNYILIDLLNKIKSPLSLLKNLLKNSYSIKLKISLEKRNRIKFNYLREDEIKSRIKAFEKIFNKKIKSKIFKIDNNVFMIRASK